MKLRAFVAAGTLLGSLAAAQMPQEPPPQESETGREVRGQEPGRPPPGIPRGQLASSGWPIMEWHHLSGEWGGFRTQLNELGIVPEVFLTTDASVVAAGGVNEGGTAFRSLLDATVTVDAGKLMGWHGARFFVDVQVQRGSNGSEDVGDLQGYSNIDSENRTQFAKVWYEQVLFDRAVRIKVGKADANTDFAYVENGFRFLNSAFGYSPTILGFPSYPDAAYGAAAFVRPGAGLYAGVGVYDGAGHVGVRTGESGPSTLFGAPSDLFTVVELGRRWTGHPGGLGRGRLGVGAHHHSGDFARFDGGSEEGVDGFYLVLDQQLWQPDGAPDSDRGLGGFFRYGYADGNVSLIEHHVGAGVAWTGPFVMRPDDAVGFGITRADFTDQPGAGLQGSGETAYELFYTFQVSPWLRLKPDLQYIDNPGGLGVDDAVVFTLRCAISF